MLRTMVTQIPNRLHDCDFMKCLRNSPYEGVLYAQRGDTRIVVPVDGVLYLNDSRHEPGTAVRIRQGDTLQWCPGHAA